MNNVYNEKNMHLKGIMTKEMMESLGISIEKTTKHGVIKLSYGTCDLYEVPAPYDEIDVFYGSLANDNDLIPHYFFSKSQIKEYELAPIGENEFPTLVCFWYVARDENRKFKSLGTTKHVYNRKNEEKYRLRFLTDPTFDPRDWEMNRS
jgi:hypothetical protein